MIVGADGVPCFDRGEPVVLTAVFPAEPDEVYVSYVVPVTEEPRVDDGHGEPKSRIERVGGVEDGLPTYRYSIDTSDFPSGDGWWRFWAVGRRFRGGRDARVGKFRINEAPPQL